MAEEKKSRVKSALGGDKKKKKSEPKKSDKKGDKKKKKIRSMHIKRTDNGKFLVDHEFDNAPGEEMMPNETHALNPEELQGHIGMNMGIPETGSVGIAGPGAGPSPEPMPGPAPAAGPVMGPGLRKLPLA